MTANTHNLSKLTGYIKWKRPFVPSEQIEEKKEEIIDETVVQEDEVVITNEKVETEQEKEQLTEPEQEPIVAEEVEKEESEDSQESEEGEEISDDSDDSEFNETDKEILEIFNDIRRAVGKTKFDKLIEFDEKSMDKLIISVESAMRNYSLKVDKMRSLVEDKEQEIVDIKLKQSDWEKEQKLKSHELSRYSLDDDDEYVLNLKQKISKEPDNQLLKDKLRDEYLRRVSDIEPEFDMFESRNKIISKRSQGIDNLSSSNKSTPATLSRETPVPVSTWFAKRVRQT